MQNLARRRFIRGGALSREGRQGISEATQPMGVPPPGLHSIVAQGSCFECSQECVAACDEGIIQIHGQEHAFGDIPYLDFSNAGCTFCGDCIEACPAVVDSYSGLWHQAIGRVKIDLETCLAWNKVICVTCRSSCPEGAIRLDLRSMPNINPETCNGCGWCQSGCPNGSIRIEMPE